MKTLLHSSSGIPSNREDALKAYGRATRLHGPPLAFAFLVTVKVARSTNETSFEGPLAVNNVLPSGESVMPHGRAPTSTEPAILLSFVSIAKTCLPRPVLT